MKQFKIEDVLKGTGGKLVAEGSEKVVSGVKIDSREVKPGDIFVAIRGENNDGHNYIHQVIEAGCKTVIISDESRVSADSDCNFIYVEDTVEAVQKLAVYYLNNILDIKIVGVTGSVGKTSTSDIVRAVISSRYKTGKTMKNYNNHIGLPLSVLAFDEDTQVGVLEMGMDKPGEIEFLVNIARPDIGIITNIGISHIENLGSRENIFKAKMEITSCFDENSVLVVSGDDDFLCRCSCNEPYTLVKAGTGSENDYVIEDINDMGEEGVAFALSHKGEKNEFYVPVPGKHNALNAALAIAAGEKLGVTASDAAAGLKNIELTAGRLGIIEKDNMKVIDDTYNASPASMKSAIDVLLSTKGERKIAILGDMYELGKDSDQYHREVGEYAAESGVDMLIAIGESAAFIAEGAKNKMSGEKILYYKEKKDFYAQMSDIITSGDVILLKGSRGMHMDEIVNQIVKG